MILPKWLFKEIVGRSYDSGHERGYQNALCDLIKDIDTKIKFGKITDEEANEKIDWIRSFWNK